jgi:outer membrane protein assembly factor BamB
MPLASDVQATPRFGPPFLIVPALGLYHIHGEPVVYSAANGTYAYLWAEKDYLRRFEVRPNKSSYDIYPQNRKDAPSSKPLHAPRQGVEPIFINSMPGGILSLSANGNDLESAVVWASMPYDDDGWIKDVRGVLRAMNAKTMEQIWNNATEPQHRHYLFAKYCPPTIANGRVFLATFSGRVLVYGRTTH